MPVPKGIQVKRPKVNVDLAELQRIVDLCEGRTTFNTRTEMYHAVAAEYNAQHPDVEGLTYTVVRLRFDPTRTPGTTMTCKTPGRGSAA